MKKIVLIDGNSIMNRAFYGIPLLTNAKGMHTNAVYGFLNIMFKILDEEKPDYLTVAFDVKSPTFRHEMYSEYKGTRKGMPDELREQMPLIKETLSSMNITIVEKAGIEADDILGTIARKAEKEGMIVSLVSGDRDLLQIATDNIKIRIPKTKKGQTEIEDYNTKDVYEAYGIEPLQIIDLKGLMGDASDNIPGIPGVGEKTAIKILKEWHDVENAIANVDNITPNKAKLSLSENKDLAILSKKLATIKTDCEFEYSFDNALCDSMFNENSLKMFKELEFKTFISRFLSDVEVKNDVLSYVTVIDNIADFENLLEEVCKSDFVGLSYSDILYKALAITTSDDKIYYIKEGGFITGMLITSSILRVFNSVSMVSVNDIKKIMYGINTDNAEYIESIIDCSHIFDISIAAYLLNPLSDTYGYDDIAKNYLSMLLKSEKDLLGNAVNKVLPEHEDDYKAIAIYNSYVSYKAYDAMVKELKENGMYELMYNCEMPLAATLYDMERRGIKADGDSLLKYGKQLDERIEELELLIYDLAGEKFNINSPKQLGVILFEKMNMPFAKKTKTGYSTSADVLEKLRSEHPVINYILEYRQLTKLRSTYVEGLRGYIEEDHRIRSTFNQTITATGRISSTEPNLQNIPIRMELGRAIRKVFIPEDGFVFVDADYSQIELRVLAHMSCDEKLIEAYKKDVDIHRMTASEVFHIPLDEVTDLQRRNAKAVNFGIVYGISSFGLGQDLNISRKEAEGYIEKYFATYPKVKEFLDGLVDFAKTNGYITTMFNRKRPVPEINASNFMQRSFGERIAMNSPIQGTAADIIKIAMINVNKKLMEAGLKSRLILQIHDELLIEAAKDEVDTVKKILHDEMFNAVTLTVPLEVSVEFGNTWYDVK
ncbi:MAG: DNA polymerase I [Lachnospiraceae bacterium]|nr:DNA polymerase I [Lachnospiraceae bacterium]